MPFSFSPFVIWIGFDAAQRHFVVYFENSGVHDVILAQLKKLLYCDFVHGQKVGKSTLYDAYTNPTNPNCFNICFAASK